jgi:hypothetical protein
MTAIRIISKEDGFTLVELFIYMVMFMVVISFVSAKSKDFCYGSALSENANFLGFQNLSLLFGP